jgi:metal-responsive CopG/Arc/MetJ family transcriptional regulator
MAVLKSLTVRLPAELVTRLDAESRTQGVSRSDIVRARLEMDVPHKPPAASFNRISDLVGSVDHLPADLSARTKDYLRTSGYGRKRAR